MVESVSILLFESPVRLGVFSFVLFGAALYLRRRVSERTMPYVLPGAVATIILLFVIQHLVVTDREAVIAALRDFVRGVEQKNPAAIESAIADDFDADGLSRRDLLNIINGKLARMRIYDTRLSPAVGIEGDVANMILGARATVSIDGGVGEFHAGTWRFTWTRRDGRWRIMDLRPVRIDTIEISSWRELQSIVP